MPSGFSVQSNLAQWLAAGQFLLGLSQSVGFGLDNRYVSFICFCLGRSVILYSIIVTTKERNFVALWIIL